MRNITVVAMILFAAGCTSNGEPEPASAEPLRSSLVKSRRGSHAGDQVIHQGRVRIDGERYAFRPCDKPEIYLLIPTMGLEEELLFYTETLYGTDFASVYVRFHGHDVDFEGVIPARYTGVVKVTQLQATSANIPANCD